MDDYFEGWKGRIRGYYSEGNLDLCKSECEYLLRQVGEFDYRTKKFCYQELSYCCLKRSEIEEAEKYTVLALENAKIKDDYYSSFWNLGRIRNKQGMKDEAKRILLECIPFYKTNEMHLEAGQLYMLLGDICKEEKDFTTAEEYYKSAIECYGKSENAKESSYDDLYGEIADLYIEMGNKYIWEAQQTISKIKDKSKRNALRKEVKL